MIDQGKLKQGERLPSEYELSELLGVSRGTIRQALVLLRESGLIYQHQGKGNFLRPGGEHVGAGLEKVSNNPKQFASIPIEERRVQVEYYPATTTVQRHLERRESTLLAQFHIQYRAEGTAVAYRLYFVPYENLDTYQVDLESEEALMDFLDRFLQEEISSSDMTVSCVEAREQVAAHMERKLGTPLLCFTEQMRRRDGTVALYVKSYYDPNYFQFLIHRE